MIALLRRLRRSAGEISGAEWVLLGIETLAVVAGILIALALENWAQSYREQQHVDRLLERLLDEAQLNLLDLNQHVVRAEEKIEANLPLVSALGEGQCPTNKAFENVFQINHYPAITPPRAVYDEMIGGVGLSAIDDDQARLAISIYRNVLGFMEGQLERFRTGDDLLEASDPRLTARLVTGERDNGSVGSEPVETSLDRQALCSDHAFRNRLAYAMRNQMVFQRYREDTLNVATHMCVKLGEVVGRDCFSGNVTKILDAERIAELKQAADRVRENLE